MVSAPEDYITSDQRSRVHMNSTSNGIFEKIEPYVYPLAGSGYKGPANEEFQTMIRSLYHDPSMLSMSDASIRSPWTQYHIDNTTLAELREWIGHGYALFDYQRKMVHEVMKNASQDKIFMGVSTAPNAST